MRTTLTLDDDLAEALNRAARLTGRSFKAVVNDTPRRGLAQSGSGTAKLEPFSAGDADTAALLWPPEAKSWLVAAIKP